MDHVRSLLFSSAWQIYAARSSESLGRISRIAVLTGGPTIRTPHGYPGLAKVGQSFSPNVPDMLAVISDKLDSVRAQVQGRPP